MEKANIALAIIVALLLYATGLGIYRLWFSPVAEIPGPVLAKVTYW